MYVTLKLDDSGCRIHSISDGNEEIVTNERYVVMPWKMVTRHGKNVTLKEVVDRILNQKEFENKELERERRERESDKKLKVRVKNIIKKTYEGRNGEIK